ncbi:hypothetical protein KQX54_017136 [Cotesia glomerata]|uniref:Uncharacterized protein n=1 Tax=Cotesia glomerata TaxID=32391 RepID=A0AAV7IFU6_COTGL|nr:hypothetical protein KQX54_017136 [Cotesia glomerata]
MGPILWLIVINAITTHIYGEQIPLWHLEPGNTSNITSLKLTTAEYFDSMFNDYHFGRMLIQDDDFSSRCKINYKREMCVSLDSLKPLLYHGIYRGDDKLDVSGLNSSNTENQGYFDAFKNYFDESKYLFGLVQICRVMKTQTLHIHPLKSRDLPIVNGNIVHKIQKLPFGLLRFRRGLESHYVNLMKNHNSRELVLDLKLLPLPEAPELSRSVVGHLDVRPGDVLEPNDFSRITSSLMSSMSDSVSLSEPESVFSFSNCFKNDASVESLIKL